MQEIKFSSLNSNFPPIVIFLCLTFFFFPLFSTCRAEEQVWGVAKRDFLIKLQSGDTDFLRHVDYKRTDLEEVRALGAGAGYFMALVFEDLDMEQQVEDLARFEWEREEADYPKEAGLFLLKEYLRGEEYEEAEALGKEYLRRFPHDPLAYRRWLEAVYWQEKDEEVLKALAFIASGGAARDPRTIAAWRKLQEDDELLLFKAAAMARLTKEGWKEEFIHLFTKVRASEYHFRAYTFLLLNEDLKASFSKDELFFFYGKNLAARGEYRIAAEVFLTLLKKENRHMAHSASLEDASLAFRRSGFFTKGVEALAPYAERKGPSEVVYTAAMAVGILNRARRAYSEAGSSFKNAVESAPKPEERKRALWYYLTSLRQWNTQEFLAELERTAPEWNDPAYFDDMLEDLYTSVVAGRDWPLLLRLWPTVSRWASPSIKARGGFLLARALDHGLLTLSEGREEGAFSEKAPQSQEILNMVVSENGWTYYSLLSARYLGKIDGFFLSLPEKTRKEADGPWAYEKEYPERKYEEGEGEEALRRGESEGFISGLLRFGLYEEAFSEAFYYPPEDSGLLSRQFIILLAKELKERGMFRKSIGLVRDYLRNRGGYYDRGTLELLYPEAYLTRLIEEAEKEGLPLPLLQALVREESYFDEMAISSSGAVGLAQLMPSTAENIAQRLRYGPYVLTSPKDNLRFGAWYLGEMYRRFKSGQEAVLAYNAGPTRMRRWEEDLSELPEELRLEAVPFDETRNHGRKILVSALFYGYLYGTMTVEDFLVHYWGEAK